MPSFGLGYRRNTRRIKLGGFSKHPLSSTTFPPSADLSAVGNLPIFDQDGCSACVGHARARQIHILYAAAGRPLPFIPSPRGIYTIALCVETPVGVPLQDTGCDPVDSITGVSMYGLWAMRALPDRFSDASLENVIIRPSFKDLEDGHFDLITTDRQVTSTMDERVKEVSAAIAGGKPVCIDVAGGSEEWQNYAAGEVIQDTGARLDHYVCLVGYNVDAYNETTFLVANSWGTGWGDKGYARVGSSVLKAAGDVITNIGP